MTRVKLLNGPCDPREIDMVVTEDATELKIRPMPYDCYDIYQVTDRFVQHGDVIAATGEYVRTEGVRRQIDQYRRVITRLGAGRAFRVKRTVKKEGPYGVH